MDLIKELLSIADAFYDSGDYKFAFECYRLAALKGNGDAAHSLGELYENGIYVKQDLNAAKEWYLIAATNGYQQDRKRINKELSEPKEVIVEEDNKTSIERKQEEQPNNKTTQISEWNKIKKSKDIIAVSLYRKNIDINNQLYPDINMV